jgi:hypothetical protein
MEGGDAMSATDELRRLLDERGVEWESGLPTETIVREPNDALYVERPDGRMHVYFRSYLTPEQAIAATLGPCSDSCNCTDGERTSERMDLDAATLGVTDATGERHGVAGTCKADETERIWCRYKGWLHDRFLTVHVMECSACGGTYEYVNGSYEYCPRCGAKVVDA